jgi:hypothetical protein
MVSYYHRKQFRWKHSREVAAMLNPAAYATAQRITRELAHSALPDAPVILDLKTSGRSPLRRGAAVVLHRIADRLHSA